MDEEEQKMVEEEKAQDETSEKATKELLNQVTEQNKQIDESYEQRLKRLEQSQKMEELSIDPEKMKRLAILKEKLNEIKLRISMARRAGKDVVIADFVMRNAMPKIKIAEVTKNEADILAVNEIFANAVKELDDAEKQEEINIKKEIEQRLIQEKERMAAEQRLAEEKARLLREQQEKERLAAELAALEKEKEKERMANRTVIVKTIDENIKEKKVDVFNEFAQEA